MKLLLTIELESGKKIPLSKEDGNVLMDKLVNIFNDPKYPWYISGEPLELELYISEEAEIEANEEK